MIDLIRRKLLISSCAMFISESVRAKDSVQSKYTTVTPEMFGAVGDGVNDDTTAIERMFEADADIISFSSHSIYKLSKTIIYKGKIKVFAANAKFLCDGDAFCFIDASGSEWNGGTFSPIKKPYIITRDTSTWEIIAEGFLSGTNGYEPSGNDLDIARRLNGTILSQNISCNLVFTSSTSNPVTNIKINNVTGTFCSIILEGCSYSEVNNCHLHGGQWDAIIFWNGVDSPANDYKTKKNYFFSRGLYNQVKDNKCFYSGHNGILFAGNDYFKVENNETFKNGESGIKTMQFDGHFHESIISRHGMIIGNISYDNYYDGIDVAASFPDDKKITTAHYTAGNHLYNNRRTGLWSNGIGNVSHKDIAHDNGYYGVLFKDKQNNLNNLSEYNNFKFYKK